MRVMLPIDTLVVNHKSLAVCFLTMKRKNPAAVALGRLTSAKKAASSARNAKKATRARLAAQTEEERSLQAKKAALARWKKH